MQRLHDATTSVANFLSARNLGLFILIMVSMIFAGQAFGQARTVLFSITPEYVTDEYIMKPAQVDYFDSRAEVLRQVSNTPGCMLYFWGDTNSEFHGSGSDQLVRESTDAANESLLGISRAATFSWRAVNRHGVDSKDLVILPRAGENSKTVTVESVCFNTSRIGNYDAVMARMEALELRVDLIEGRLDDIELHNARQDDRLNEIEDQLDELRQAPQLRPPGNSSSIDDRQVISIDRPVESNGLGAGVSHTGVPHLEVRGVKSTGSPVGLYAFAGLGLASEEVYIDCGPDDDCGESGDALLRSYTFGGGLSIAAFEGVSLQAGGGIQYRHCDRAHDANPIGEAGVRVKLSPSVDLTGTLRVRYDMREEQGDVGGAIVIGYRF